MREMTKAQEIVFRGKLLTVRVDQVEQENGRKTTREVVEHPGGVGILPLNDRDEAVLVRQFRYPYGEELLEIPAGKLEPGEDPLACGLRELREETGFTAETVDSLGVIYPTPGYLDEVLHLYVARGLTPGETCPDEGEFLSIETMPFETLYQHVLDGTVRDAKTVVATLKVAARRSEEGKNHG